MGFGKRLNKKYNKVPAVKFVDNILKGPKQPGEEDVSDLYNAIAQGGVEQRGLIEKNRSSLTSLADTLAQRQTSLANQSGVENRGLITSLRPQLSPLDQQYRQQALASAANARVQGAQLSDKLLRDATDSGRTLADSQSAQLQRDIASQQPEAQQNLREALASTVGLRGGGAAHAFQRQATDTAAGLERGQEQIRQQQEQARQNAINMGYSTNEDLLMQELGIDQGTLEAIHNSGRQDLIDEVNGLLQEAQGRQGKIEGIEANRGATQFNTQQDFGNKNLTEAQDRSNANIGVMQNSHEFANAGNMAKFQNESNMRNQVINTGLQLGAAYFTGGASLAAQGAASAANSQSGGQGLGQTILSRRRRPVGSGQGSGTNLQGFGY